MNCTRCGTDTDRRALASEAFDIEESENGIIWLCDSCTSELDDWMEGKPLPRRRQIIPAIKEGERNVVTDADEIRGDLATVTFVHLAQDGSIEFTYDLFKAVENTEAGQVLDLNPEDIL